MSLGRTKARADDRGAAAVEFALLLPVLVVLIFGMIQFGLVYNAYITVTHAAREGARMASVGRYSAAAVKADMVPLDQAQISVPAAPTLDASGDYYSVTVTYHYLLDIPLWRTEPLELSSTARMRRE